MQKKLEDLAYRERRAYNADERRELIRSIHDEILNLIASPLYGERVKNKYNPVIGQGDHYAKIMFVGEAPGKNEALTGVPFCGRAGKILDALLKSVKISREVVYITNIVKDRPPMNRDPSQEEITLYAPFLCRQIEIIQPKVIATLGRFSMAYCMEKFGLSGARDVISKIHGRAFDARASYGVITLIPLYHPAATIYNPKLRKIMEKDFQILKRFKN
ncbi:MAG: uracil-DNA glycosylase [Patescibacteria group bacterium]